MKAPNLTTDDPPFQTVESLEEALSRPTDCVIEAMANLEGDLLILGAAGKMGPTLARMAKRASDAAGSKYRIIAISRFSNPDDQATLESHGLETIRCDLLDPKQLANLPDAANIIYMPGMKFGSSGNESLTWAMNTWLPASVCQRYPDTRIVAFSTGNIYGLVPITQGGSVESALPNPSGEYAMSCLGRERMFEHFSKTQGTPVSIIRLNYACELRYGVLVDLARQVIEGRPIDLSMGVFNVIWQADANAISLCSLDRTASPPFILNVAGPELLSVRLVSCQLGKLMGKSVTFTGEESNDALVNNGQLAHQLYGYPRIGSQQMICWVAEWVKQDRASLGKPTHFEARDGKC